ncbi:BTAD domain-containing putative transcriptional regulator [Virgisporangium aurantiacum]|uniref:BTAD domain-containing putative transcriptional regulator n=1 Tax=Virgisporangium aurantiacum TaxID=175570 RepID=UPI00195177CD|nr:BTAD domain-containing putative transcriptional regulator [Virgisporangium aurantiacum]
MLRFTGRLASTVALLGILVGVPAGLCWFVGSPLPRTLPTTWDAWARILTSSIPDEAVINVLAIALWIVWAAFAYSVAVEIAAARRGKLATRRRLISPLQAVAALLIAGMTAGPATVLVANPARPVVPAVAPHIPTANATASEAITAGGGRIILTVGDARSATPTTRAWQPADSATAALTHDEMPRFAACGVDGALTLQVGDNRYTVTVSRHDTLWKIAEVWLGDPHRWPEIYHLNQDRYDHNGRMKHGDHIEPGWVLILPADALPPAGAQPIPPPPSNPVPPDNNPSGTPTAPPSSSPSSPSSPSGDAIDDGVVGMPPRSSGSPAPSEPSASAAPARSDRDGGFGIELSGGWVVVPVATAVAAAAALVWIQRRRRYRPRPPANGRRDDPDLTPLPPSIAALHHARPPSPIEDDMDDLAPEALEATTVTTATLGTRADRPLRLADLPPSGVGLVGPGARAAARGVLVAVLSAGGPWAPGAEAAIVTTDADLAALLGPTAPDRDQLGQLHIADSLDSALTHLERQLLRRVRQADDRNDSDLSTVHDQAHAPIVLLTQAPDDTIATALAAILAVGSRLAIAGVLLGRWNGGATWHVNSDGTSRPDPATDTTGLRLNVLDTATAGDILDILRQARPTSNDIPPPPSRAASHTAAAASRTDPLATRQDGTPAPTTSTTARSPNPHNPTGTTDVRTLRFSVLGKPTLHLVSEGSRRDIRIRRTDGTQILVHLAVEPDGSTSDQLMAVLWPETRPHVSRRRFHTTMSELRQTLAEAVGAETIPRTDERYRLDPAHITVDLWKLTAAADDAATAVDPAHHAAALRQVIKLYTGSVAEGHHWLWLAPYRERVRRHILDAYIGLADNAPDPAAALALVQEAIRVDPYNEDVYQRAMQLHATLNSADGVVRTLRALTQRLADLEIEVSPQTQQIATELLAKLDARRRNRGNAA